MARMIAQAKAPSGTTISGPISISPHGAGAVRGYRELYLRSFAQRARCVDGSIVRPHRLTRDGEPKPGAARLVGDVRLPDLLEALRSDPFAVVGNRDSHRVASSELRQPRRDCYLALAAGSIDGVEQYVAQCARQSAVLTEYPWKILV